MPASELQLDHAVLDVGNNLDATVAALEACGFIVSPESSHHGVRNRRIYMKSTYLTLFEATETVGAQDARSRGIIGMALKNSHLDAVAATWRESGFEVSAPADLSREVDLDGQRHTARFRTLDLPHGSVGNLHVFFCHHRTPELLWRPEWQSHANGAIDLVEIVVAARQPALSARRLSQLTNLEARSIQGGARIGTKQSITFLTPEQIAVRFGSAAAVAETLEEGEDLVVALVLEATNALPSVKPTDGNVIITFRPSLEENVA